MSYVKSLRFKLMLLCVIPVLSVAFLFIAHSVIIALQVRGAAAEAYYAALLAAEAPDFALQAVQDVSLNMGWIGKQWAVVFIILFICFYIPITINIGKFIKPIRRLAADSNSLARGDINVDVTKDRTDEIGLLQESFRNLVSASRKQAELIEHIADGDISLDYVPRSEKDVVGHSIVKMLEHNNAIITQLTTAINEIAQVSSHIAIGSQELASGSTEQAAAISELSSSMEGIAQIPNDNMRMAKSAGDLADEIKQNAENGNHQMKQMVTAVREIRESSLNVQKVIKVIDEIAFQTNILALNAAVEAARAGQHGKGFAVVAEEVRNLATKSAEAAKDTGVLIDTAMEKSDLGVRIADETSASLDGIVSGISENSKIVQEISDSSKEQDVSITGISESINQMAQVVQKNSASAESYAAASEQMSSQAEILRGLAARFKVKQAALASE